MAGSFLNAFIPLGEVAGATAGEIGAGQQRKQALSDLVGQLGPDYAGFGKAVSAGVSTDAAMSVLQTAHQQRLQTQFAQMLKSSGGQMTPDVIGFGLANGLISPKDLGNLGKPSSAQVRQADIGYINDLVTNETDPTKRAQLSAIGNAVAAGAPLSSFTSTLTALGKPPPPDSYQYVGIPGVSPTGEPTVNAYSFDRRNAALSPISSTGTPTGPSVNDGAPLSFTKPPSAQERLAMDSAIDVRRMIPNLVAAANALPDTSAATMLKQSKLYNPRWNPSGIFGKVDPAYANYFSIIGQMKGRMLPVAAQGSRGQYLFNYLNGHIPDEGDAVSTALEKVRGFDANGFDATAARMMGNPSAGSMMPTGDITLGGTSYLPPAPPLKNFDERVGPSGDYIAKDLDNGTYWKFDPRSKSWQPAK